MNISKSAVASSSGAVPSITVKGKTNTTAAAITNALNSDGPSTPNLTSIIDSSSDSSKRGAPQTNPTSIAAVTPPKKKRTASSIADSTVENTTNRNAKKVSSEPYNPTKKDGVPIDLMKPEAVRAAAIAVFEHKDKLYNEADVERHFDNLYTILSNTFVNGLREVWHRYAINGQLPPDKKKYIITALRELILGQMNDQAEHQDIFFK